MSTMKTIVLPFSILFFFCGCNDPPVVELKTTEKTKADPQLDSKVKARAQEFRYRERKSGDVSINGVLGVQVPEETFWVYCKIVNVEIEHNSVSIAIENDKMTFEAMFDPEEVGNRLWHKGDKFTLHFDLAEMGMGTRFEPGSFAYFGLTKDRQLFMILYPAVQMQ